MAKKIWLTVFLIALLFLCPLKAQAQEVSLDTEPVEALLAQLDEEYAAYFGLEYFSNLWQGEEELTVQSLVQAMASYLQYQLKSNISLMGKLLFLAVLSALLGNLEQAFGQKIGKLARLVIFFLAVLMIMEQAQSLWQTAGMANEKMIGFMDAVLPVQLVLLAAAGGVGTTAAMQPTLFLLVNVVGNAAEKIILPGIYFCLLLAIVNSMSDKYRLDKLESLLKKLLIWGFGALSSIFLLVLSISGTVAAAGDGLGIRGIKYAAGTFVPIVGDLLVNTAEMVASGSVLIKNVFGILALIIILLLAVLPALKVLVIGVLYKLTSALIQPLGEEMLCELLNETGQCFVLLFAAVAIIGLMFFLSLAILVMAANMTLMLR